MISQLLYFLKSLIFYSSCFSLKFLVVFIGSKNGHLNFAPWFFPKVLSRIS